MLEMNGLVRYWRNLGGGRFDLPRLMQNAPGGLALAQEGVQFVDANGDGRTDLLVTSAAMSGYFPLRFTGQWDQQSFRRYSQAPSFSLKDPEVKLVDLDGDGVTDAVRSGTRLECFFSDPKVGWQETLWVERQALEVFPNLNFSDPRVKWGDFTGDGLQTMALVYDGNVEYWPHFGRGRWGRRVHMEHSPRFPYGYDPQRILVGDVDGDGLADIVYVDDSKITLWINQSGNRWSDPITIVGTPPVAEGDAVRLADVLGSGTAGVLWSRHAPASSRDCLFFLDFTGGVKPYLLREMDNHMGAMTKVEYAPSTRFYRADQERPEPRWKTTLPFPVQVVWRVEVIDHFSGGKLTTEYQYHHGYWDGAEREFRGFGMVERRDTESFETYNNDGLHGSDAAFTRVERQHFSPPALVRTWFHQGPVGDEFGEWQELDWSPQYWVGDPQILGHTQRVNEFLGNWPSTPDGRRAKRDALRALRGSVLRTELFALDGSDREGRPYTVTEFAYGLEEIEPPPGAETDRQRIFFPHSTARRTTQWERGDDPLTGFSFTRYTDEANANAFDPLGRPLAVTEIACPRGWRAVEDQPSQPYLASRTRTAYAAPIAQGIYIHDRVAKVTHFELLNTTWKRVLDLARLTDASADLKVIGQSLSYYDGEAFLGLPLQQVGRFGAVSRSQKLVLTRELLQEAYGAEIPPYFAPAADPVWPAEYPLEFRALLARRAGYEFRLGSADPSDPRGYFVNIDRRRYDFQTNASGTGRGLLMETVDPLHDATGDPTAHRVLIGYDDYGLLPVRVTDAAGLVTAAKHDYRLFQPKEVIDPNGNQRLFTFSPLGLLENSYVLGKAQTEGDQQRPSVRMEYGFRAFEDSLAPNRQPIFVRTIRQIHHDTELDVPLPQREETITTVEYSDGFGRVLQTRTQAEEVRFGDERFGGGEAVLPARQSNGAGGDVIGRRNSNAANPNVVVSGWQIYDNKGQVIEKYEPFFSQGWEYGQPDEFQTGQKVVMFYDPRGNTIRTLHPDGSQQQVIYGVPGSIAVPDLAHPEIFEPTPWEAHTYDANDNAGRTHSSASADYRHHWDTPASSLIDALGRPIQAVARNRDAMGAPGGALLPIQEITTLTTYDIRGNVLAIVDPLGRTAFRHVYDYANSALRVESIDAGIRLKVFDAAGGLIEQRDGKGALALHSYDKLNRPVRLWARDETGQKLTLREQLEYGDSGQPGQPAGDRETHRALNRLGRPFRHFDEAGLVVFESYDFKGNPLEKSRRVVSDAAILSVFAGPPVGWKVQPFLVDWDDPASTPLDVSNYTSSLRYDALNRVNRMIYPADVENQRRQLVPRYNRAGALEGVALELTGPGDAPVSSTFVEQIAYNAKGQRVLIAYGNGVMTRYAYDPQTFQLLRLRTERYSAPSSLTYRPAGQLFQEFGYEHDLVGNISTNYDRTPGSGIIGSPFGIDQLNRRFTYDAIYRLRSATGRECDAPPDLPWDAGPRDTNLTKTRGYVEEYLYDAAGNIEQLKHLSNNAGFDRQFELMAGNNRLIKMTIGATTFDYQYDINGNMTRETTSRHFEWDWADRMKAFRTQTNGSEPSVHAHYLYNAAGQRVKKLVRKQGGQVEVTVYIDGVFEYQRVVQGGTVRQNNTLHVMNNQSRIAVVRVGNPFPADATPSVKYHLGDRLGSSNVAVDASGNIINREEYTPYGETSFGSFAFKRYRYTGKERDHESGCFYHGARYYAPWLGKWITCDPAGLRDGPNLYTYAANSPLRYKDATGLQSFDSSGGPAPPLPDVTSATSINDSSGGPVPPPSSTPDVKPSEPRGISPYDLPDAPREPSTKNNLQSTAPPMKVPWTYPPNKDFVLAPVQSVDTGSEPMNYAAAIWASWCNVLAAIPNLQSATKAGVERDVMSAAQPYGIDVELRNAGDVLHMTPIGTTEASAAAQALTAYGTKALKGSVFTVMGSGMFSPLYIDYPANRPRPKGPVELVPKDVYQGNKLLKEAANAALREKHADFFENTWADIHEPHPIRFGGDPADVGNKEIISPPEHWEVTKWWNALQRWVEGQ